MFPLSQVPVETEGRNKNHPHHKFFVFLLNHQAQTRIKSCFIKIIGLSDNTCLLSLMHVWENLFLYAHNPKLIILIYLIYFQCFKDFYVLFAYILSFFNNMTFIYLIVYIFTLGCFQIGHLRYLWQNYMLDIK